MPFHESAVRHDVEADDGVRRELTAAGRSRLDSARLQHTEPSPEDTGREDPVSGLKRPASSVDPLSGHCCAMPCRAVDSTGIKVEGEGALSAACLACACRVISGTHASIPLTHASMCCRAAGGPKRRVHRPTGHCIAMSRKVGAKSISGSTSKRWRFGRLRSPVATSATRRFCPICSARSQPTKRLQASPLPLGTSRRDALPGSGRYLRHTQVPQRNCRPRFECRHPGPQKRQTLEDRHRKCGGQKRGPSSFEIPWPRDLAKLERIPPPKPRRDEPSRDHAMHNPAGQWMHCMKLLGQRLMARDFDRQVAEVEVRIAVVNGYTALGIPVTEAVG
jgi:hypothetical protein